MIKSNPALCPHPSTSLEDPIATPPLTDESELQVENRGPGDAAFHGIGRL
jgi:hypothetical protein